MRAGDLSSGCAKERSYPAVSVSINGLPTWRRLPCTGVNLDVIRTAAPFSLDFYRQFVRDTFDNDPGTPWPVLRWTTAPSFYVKTTDQNGRAIEPEVLVRVLDGIRAAVPAYTAGR